MRIALAIILIAYPIAAMAQAPSDADLDHALGLCSQHITPPVPGTKPKPISASPTYAAGWEQCAAIRQEVLNRRAQTDTAAAQAAIKSLAGQLSPAK
jgi:hypothetical protein